MSPSTVGIFRKLLPWPAQGFFRRADRSSHSPGRAQLQSFPPSGYYSRHPPLYKEEHCLPGFVSYLHPVQGGLSLAPSFLPYPKFVVSWLLSNTHPSGSSLYSCTTSLYQRTYSRKNFHLGSYGGLRPPVEMLFRLPLRLSSLQSQLDRKKMSSSISCLPYLTIRSI